MLLQRLFWVLLRVSPASHPPILASCSGPRTAVAVRSPQDETRRSVCTLPLVHAYRPWYLHPGHWINIATSSAMDFNVQRPPKRAPSANLPPPARGYRGKLDRGWPPKVTVEDKKCKSNLRRGCQSNLTFTCLGTLPTPSHHVSGSPDMVLKREASKWRLPPPPTRSLFLQISVPFSPIVPAPCALRDFHDGKVLAKSAWG